MPVKRRTSKLGISVIILSENGHFGGGRPTN